MVAAVMLQAVPGDVFPVKQDFSFCGGVQPAQEGEQRRLPEPDGPRIAYIIPVSNTAFTPDKTLFPFA